tara:strand:- start:54348 stop:54929 length:582 start_codon:yes stop_codon:yes gene_type:complete
MSKIAIFASGAGSNADRILQFSKSSQSGVQIDCLLTNKKVAGIYEVAERNNVPIFYFSIQDFSESTKIVSFLRKREIEWIVLAGFLRKVEIDIVNAYKNKIFNLHPSLLPKFGGKGMYGGSVHKAVIDSEEKESGITIHLVNSEFDKGEIIFQAKCPVSKGQTAEELAKKIQKLEHKFFTRTIENYINNSMND